MISWSLQTGDVVRLDLTTSAAYRSDVAVRLDVHDDVRRLATSLGRAIKIVDAANRPVAVVQP